jgi:hypothetical protein
MVIKNLFTDEYGPRPWVYWVIWGIVSLAIGISIGICFGLALR